MSESLSGIIGLSLPFLAQLAPAPAGAPTEHSAAIWWLMGLAAVAVAFNAISSAWERLSGRFAERRGDGPEYQRREDCMAMHNGLTDVMQRINREHAERTEILRREIKSDMSSVYDRIESKTDGINNRLTGISQFMGEIAGQVKRIANGAGHD